MRNLYFESKYWSKKSKSWFTLVELIIVVVIIAILATIAFLTLWDYPMQAREIKRLSDKNNIEKALEIYKSQKWEYPNFDEENWQKIFWTWAWEKVNTSLSTLPRDPLTNKLYRIEIKETPDKVKLAKVVLEWESKILNNTTYSGTSEDNKESKNNDLIYKWEPDSNICKKSMPDRFKVNWQVITDSRTWLVWSRETNNSWLNWEAAKNYCANLTTWWKTNWRLPDITELRSIRNLTCMYASYSEFDTLENNHNYWSSTVVPGTSLAETLSFYSGENQMLNKSLDAAKIICVSK